MKALVRIIMTPVMAVTVALGGIFVAAPALALPPVRHVEVQFNINLNAQPGQNDVSQTTVCFSKGYTHPRNCNYNRYGYIRPNVDGTVTPIRKAGEKLQPKLSYTVYWSSKRVIKRIYRSGSPAENYHSNYYRADLYLETLHVNYSYK